MLTSLTSKRSGIQKKQIDMIEAELKRLQEIYKDVEILELSGFDDEGGEGQYCRDAKAIEINRDTGRKLLSELETIKARKRLREKIEKRKQMGLELKKENDTVYNCVRGLVSLARHEFAHAIIDQYNLESDGEITMLYFSILTKEEITRDLSEYANKDIGEFLAVAFEESFYLDSSNLAKRVRKMIDKKVGILNE